MPMQYEYLDTRAMGNLLVNIDSSLEERDEWSTNCIISLEDRYWKPNHKQSFASSLWYVKYAKILKKAWSIDT